MNAAQAEIVRYLLKFGADVNALNDAYRSPLHLAALNNTPEIVEILLAHGPNLNLKDRDQMTCVHIAAQNGLVPILKMLLQAQPDLSLRNDRGYLARDLARDIQTLALFEEANAPNLYGRTRICNTILRDSRSDHVERFLLARDWPATAASRPLPA